MSGSARLRHTLTKEVRALSLPLLTSVAAMAAAVVGPRGFWSIGYLGYFLGAVALGALVIGHEYSHRTLAALLSHPVRRERLFVVKAAVLSAMLLALSVIGGVTLFGFGAAVSGPRADRGEGVELVVLPILSGLFFAPWLTMACRSPIAGAVFATVPPGLLMLAGRLLGGVIYGFGARQVDAFQMSFFWWTLPIACAAAAVITWRMFMRLEAIDGPGPDVRLPMWLRPRGAESAVPAVLTKRHPAWQLARKELRLQTMPLAIAVFWTFGWLATITLTSVYPELPDIFRVLTVFYSGSIALLIGALASAEERHFGTLEWQTLFPMSSRAQWAIKVGMAMGLALVLGVGLPALLVHFTPTGYKIGFHANVFFKPQIVFSITLLTIVGLYVSSLNTSGLRALLMSLPAILGAALFFRFVVTSLGGSLPDVLARLVGLPLPLDSPAFRLDMRIVNGLAPALTMALLILALRFALANHRSTDRAGRAWTQVLWMAGCLTIGVVLLAGFAAIA
jgi:hypothetical protein